MTLFPESGGNPAETRRAVEARSFSVKLIPVLEWLYFEESSLGERRESEICVCMG